jgi:hypothetical protein
MKRPNNNTYLYRGLVMHRILFLPDIRPADIRLIQKSDTENLAGYMVKAGYWISGRIFVLTNIFLVK